MNPISNKQKDQQTTIKQEKWLITHDSKLESRPPHTEIINESIESWLKQHKDSFVLYCYKLA